MADFSDLHGAMGLFIFLNHPMRCKIPKEFEDTFDRLMRETHKQCETMLPAVDTLKEVSITIKQKDYEKHGSAIFNDAIENLQALIKSNQSYEIVVRKKLHS